MLELIDVKKYYKLNKAVDGINFRINKGDALGLIGENGAGKSTTISMIATLVKPDFGDILFEKESILKNPAKIRKKLGYVPQEIALYSMLSGLDNLKFWGRAYHIGRRDLDTRIQEISDIIGINKKVLNDKIEGYSGGMKRRLNIGVALLHKPGLVVMDEPTVGIDVKSRNQILETIKNLNQSGITILYTGHYMEEIEQICNKICIMEGGKVLAIGDKDEMLTNHLGQVSLEEFYLSAVGREST